MTIRHVKDSHWGHFLEPGDIIIDPMDGERRTVSHIWGETIYLTDGGVMSVHEKFEIRLPGEEAAA